MTRITVTSSVPNEAAITSFRLFHMFLLYNWRPDSNVTPEVKSFSLKIILLVRAEFVRFL